MQIGYHLSHEQFPPRSLLELVQRAEKAGFDAALSSDHFHPWSRDQGQSGFAWSWLGAAMQATKLPMGVVCAPGQRYHPAIIAQAAATLSDMFPGRFWLALGSGQRLNEGIVGSDWPTKEDRNARLHECVQIMRALWRGETVTRHGHVVVEEATLHTLPPAMPPVIGAALTPQTAQWLAGWADGMITVAKPRQELQEIVDAFRRGGGEGKPIILKVQIAYAEDDQAARQGAWKEWRTTIFKSHLLSDLRTPEQFEAAAQFVTEDDLLQPVRVSADPGLHLQWLQEDLQMGFEQLILHNVTRDQWRFIEDFGERVLPGLRG
jgi:coenzyme F420-dependent glucose-6-phosphate dehydrogenase